MDVALAAGHRPARGEGVAGARPQIRPALTGLAGFSGTAGLVVGARDGGADLGPANAVSRRAVRALQALPDAGHAGPGAVVLDRRSAVARRLLDVVQAATGSQSRKTEGVNEGSTAYLHAPGAQQLPRHPGKWGVSLESGSRFLFVVVSTQQPVVSSRHVGGRPRGGSAGGVTAVSWLQLRSIATLLEPQASPARNRAYAFSSGAVRRAARAGRWASRRRRAPPPFRRRRPVAPSPA